MSIRVDVEPSVLEWAQERSGKTEEEVAHKFTRWPDWVRGQTSPTLNQLEQIASYTRVPFGVFFLSEPPEVELPIPDFRLGPTGQDRTPSPELLDSIYASQRRQEWFRDYAVRNELDTVDLVGAGRDLTPEQAASLATEVFNFGVGERPSKREDTRNHLRWRFEELGGLVIFAGIVGNNTHRVLDREEFRGFTLADERVPLIFVNANDTLAGQFFTFFHEFAHVLRAESGVSDEDLAVGFGDDTERWCNAVAAEVLVPGDDLRAQFRGQSVGRDLLDRLSKRYLASTLVVLLRLRALELIPARGFPELYEAELDHIEAIVARQAKPTGGDFWNNQPFRIGERLGRAIIAETRAGRTAFTEALGLLGLKSVVNLNTYAEKLGMR